MKIHVDQARSDGGISVYIPPNQSTLNLLCGCFVSLQRLVNIYTHPNQIPGYASDVDPHFQPLLSEYNYIIKSK